MQLVPISHYASPGYPTEDAVQSEPSLLRVVPRRWKGNRAVLTALAAALALTQGCTSKPVARLAGTPVVPDLKTEKEVCAPRHAGPKPTATPSPTPTPKPQPAVPQTFSAKILGDPAPPNFTTEADVSPRPSPAPALTGTDRVQIRGAIAVPRIPTEDEAKALPAPSAQPTPVPKP